MKSDFSLKISVLFLLPLLLAGIFGLCVFGKNYWDNRKEIKSLEERESELRKEILDWERYGKWTLDYVRIQKGLEKISGDKISESVRKTITERIWLISMTYGIDPLLILAVVQQESRGNPVVRGRYSSGAYSGAYGLMQIKIETAQKLGKSFGIKVTSEDDLMKPEINVVLGTAYLMRLIGRYGNIKHALLAYNMGHGHVDRALASGKPLSTKYYEGVISKYWTLASDSIFIDLQR